MRIGPDILADLFFQLNWTSDAIRHTDGYAARQVNFWRDLLPRRLKDRLEGMQPGDDLTIDFAPGEIFGDKRQPELRGLSRHQFAPERIGAPALQPRMGRFYPKGALKDVAGIYRANVTPFRCIGCHNGHMTVDMGHPLADRPLSLTVTVGGLSPKRTEKGGGMQDWMELLTDGVGMQAPWRNQPTDFFEPSDFARADENPDPLFYQKPRMVQHLDDRALEVVRELYGRFVQPGMRVLDLMAAWDSHLPPEVNLQQVTGIGLNDYELSRNKALTDYRVHDLNADCTLALPDKAYDVAICTASVEYLTAPLAVMDEVARVLVPGGLFIVTFSNRWFPPKAIQLWSRLHEFERMGLVLEYFRRSRGFQDLQTYSIRGLERPVHDKYYGRYWLSDPVYAVWGRTA